MITNISTDWKIWKLMLIIFLLLSFVFVLFFYFSSISLTIVTGIVLILITENLRNYYRQSLNKYNFKGLMRSLQKYGVLFIWIFVIAFLIFTSISSLASSLQAAVGQDINLNVKAIDYINNNLLSQLPDFIRFNFLDKATLQKIADTVFGYFSTFFSQSGFIFINGIIIIPLMFYAYYRKRQYILQNICDILPDKFRANIIKAANKVNEELYEFFNAKLLESTVIAVLCCFGFFIGGVKGWLIFGLIAGFLNIVPYIGPLLGAIPPLLMTIILDDPVAMIIAIITVAIAQLIDNFYLQPFMIPGKVKIDSLLSIILILVGAQMLGVAGMIFAIPVYLVYKVILKEAYLVLVNINK